jgi:hypothetical protein
MNSEVMVLPINYEEKIMYYSQLTSHYFSVSRHKVLFERESEMMIFTVCPMVLCYYSKDEYCIRWYYYRSW